MFDVLVVDDEKDIRDIIAGILKDEGYSPRTAENASKCMEALKRKCPDILLLDIWLKDGGIDGIDILKYVKKNYPAVPVIIISGHGTIEIAVAAIKQGAYDFIEKPFNIGQLLVTVERAREMANFRQKDKKQPRPILHNFQITGDSSAANALRKKIHSLANKNRRILIYGDNGTGKYHAAQLIHALSNRANMPFYRLECANPNFLSFLYGKNNKQNHVFSKSIEVSNGVLKKANGGIIYLNEISNLSTNAQESLLHFLTNKNFIDAETQSQISVNVRIIASTQENFENAAIRQKIRTDLYDRLSIATLHIPNLQRRIEDIEALAKCFIKDISTENHIPSRPLDKDALEKLKSLKWPGNMRQLKNFLEQILIFGSRDQQKPIKKEELLQNHHPFENFVEESPDSQNAQYIKNMPLREARKVFEREYLAKQIKRFGGNISRTSHFIGMERSALHRKLRTLNIETSKKTNTE